MLHADGKRVTAQAWAQLHAAYGGGPELADSDACTVCLAALLQVQNKYTIAAWLLDWPPADGPCLWGLLKLTWQVQVHHDISFETIKDYHVIANLARLHATSQHMVLLSERQVLAPSRDLPRLCREARTRRRGRRSARACWPSSTRLPRRRPSSSCRAGHSPATTLSASPGSRARSGR